MSESEPVIKNLRSIFDVVVESGSIRVVGSAQAVNNEIRDFNGGFYKSERYLGSLYFNNKNNLITRHMETEAAVYAECQAAFDSAVAEVELSLVATTIE